MVRFSSTVGRLLLVNAAASFADDARWSYGCNRLQIEAEMNVLADVKTALLAVAQIGSSSIGLLRPLDQKVDLLVTLLDNELSRLQVWLYPLDHGSRFFFAASHSTRPVPTDVRAKLILLEYRITRLRTE
jgi:phosphatidylinositol 4-kinase